MPWLNGKLFHKNKLSDFNISPLVDIMQSHLCKSFEALIKIAGFGWWLTMLLVADPDEGPPCSDECCHCL